MNLFARLSLQGRLLRIRAVRKSRGDQEYDLLPMLVKRGMTAIDVGANRGVYTFPMARRAKEVVAYEPNPWIAGFLASGAPKNVRVRNVAVSDKPGEVTLRVPRRADGKLAHNQGSIERYGEEGTVSAVVNGNSYFNLIPTDSPRLDKFHVAVNVQFVQGNDDGQSAYGLAFRHVHNDYGFLGILKTGDFLALEVHHTGIYQSLGGHHPAVDTRPGYANRLEVVGIGSDFVFLINGRQVGMMTADIEPGQIGLGVDSARRASEAQVEFSEFEVHAP